MFVNRLLFLVTILPNITLITFSYMPSCTANNLHKGMMQGVLVCHQRGLTVTTAMMDNQFDPLCGIIGDIDSNVTATAEHASLIECCIQMIKKQVRVQRSQLPFSRLPVQVVIGLVLFCVFLINAFPHRIACPKH